MVRILRRAKRLKGIQVRVGDETALGLRNANRSSKMAATLRSWGDAYGELEPLNW